MNTHDNTDIAGLDCYHVTILRCRADGCDEIQIRHTPVGAAAGRPTRTVAAHRLPQGSYEIIDPGLGTAKMGPEPKAGGYDLFRITDTGRALDFSGTHLWLYNVGETVQVPVSWTPIVLYKNL